jgi:DNA repair exonuclease SbcCD ATPase subunit
MTERSLIVMKKRAIAILLAVSMMVTFMPAMAFAATGDPVEVKSTADIDALINGQMDYGVQKLADLLNIIQKHNDQIDATQDQVMEFVIKANKFIDALQDADKDDIEAFLREHGKELDELISKANLYVQSLGDDMAELQAALKDFVAKAVILRDFLNEYRSDFTPEEFAAYLQELKTKLDALDISVEAVAKEFGKQLDLLIVKINQYVQDLGEDMPNVQAAFKDFAAKAEVLRNFLGDYRNDFTPEEFADYLAQLQAMLDDMDLAVADIQKALVTDLTAEIEAFQAWVSDWQAKGNMVAQMVLDRTSKYYDLAAKCYMYCKVMAEDDAAFIMGKFNEAQAKLKEAVDAWVVENGYDVKVKEAMACLMDKYADLQICLAELQAEAQKYAAQIGAEAQAILQEKMAEAQALLEVKIAEAQAALTNLYKAMVEESSKISAEAKAALINLMEKASDLETIKAQAEAIKAAALAEAAALEATYEELKAQMKEFAKDLSLKEKAALEKKIIEAKAAAEKAKDKAKDVAKEVNKEVAKAQAAFVKAADAFKDQLEDMVADEIGKIINNVTAAIPEVLDRIDKIITAKDDILDLVEDLIAYAYGYAEGDTYIALSTKLFEAEATIEDLEGQLMEAQEVAEQAIFEKEAAEKAKEDAEKAKAAAEKAKAEAEKAKDATDKSYDKLVKNIKKAKKVVTKRTVLNKKKTKNLKGRKIVVRWKKLKGVTPSKYQVYYKAKGKKAKRVLVSAKSTKKVLKKLKKGQTYTIKVRAKYSLPYKNSKTGKVSYVTFYSKWSKTKKVTVKK